MPPLHEGLFSPFLEILYAFDLQEKLQYFALTAIDGGKNFSFLHIGQTIFCFKGYLQSLLQNLPLPLIENCELAILMLLLHFIHKQYLYLINLLMLTV